VRYLSSIVFTLLAVAVNAQTYPDKPVTMIASFPPGGSVDLVARAVAQQMSETWKQPVVVTNRPGAGGNIGAEAVARAAPDGYTVLIGTTALSSSPALYSRLSYDVTRDLAPVSLVVTMSNVLVIHPSLPARSVKQLLSLSKAQQGTLASASAGVGSSNHLALVLFNTMTGADIAHIPYKGAAPAVADVMGGHVAMTFVPIAAAVPPVRANRLRALAVTGIRRSPTLPDVPTIDESGVSGYEATSWYAVFTRSGTPRAIVDRLNEASAKAVNSPDIHAKLVAASVDPETLSPEQLTAKIRRDYERWGKVVKEAGITAQ